MNSSLTTKHFATADAYHAKHDRASKKGNEKRGENKKNGKKTKTVRMTATMEVREMRNLQKRLISDSRKKKRQLKRHELTLDKTPDEIVDETITADIVEENRRMDEMMAEVTRQHEAMVADFERCKKNDPTLTFLDYYELHY